MKRKISALLTACLLLGSGSALADGLDFLKPIWMQMMNDDSLTEQRIPEHVSVTCSEERLSVEKCGVMLENEYAAEAHVYAVLRNTSSQRLPIQSVQITAKNAGGKALHEERYASHMPDVVEPGGTLLVSEWMYGFTKDISKVDSVEIAVETNMRAYSRWIALDSVRAWQEGQYLYVELTNTTEETLFGTICGAAIENADGQILDMLLQNSYDMENLGILPGSGVVLRKRLEDGATLNVGPDAVCEAWAYRMIEN